jgi:hypothetical protein
LRIYFVLKCGTAMYVSEELLINNEWIGSQFLPKPQADGKIVGGLPAKITDYPYQVGHLISL